jgi:hypothetical protein
LECHTSNAAEAQRQGEDKKSNFLLKTRMRAEVSRFSRFDKQKFSVRERLKQHYGSIILVFHAIN